MKSSRLAIMHVGGISKLQAIDFEVLKTNSINSYYVYLSSGNEAEGEKLKIRRYKCSNDIKTLTNPAVVDVEVGETISKLNGEMQGIRIIGNYIYFIVVMGGTGTARANNTYFFRVGKQYF